MGCCSIAKGTALSLTTLEVTAKDSGEFNERMSKWDGIGN